MIELFDCEQGSPEWHAARLGIPTASCFADVMAKGQGKTRRTYLMKVLAERFTGQPMDNYTNAHMERGKEMEDEARNAYAFLHDTDYTRIGFIRNGRAGCSPDGLIGDNGILEIKSRLPYLQLEVQFAGKLPPEHMAQVQGGLWVAEREFCDFVSHCPRLPLVVVRVHRDEEYIRKLAAEVKAFCDELDILTEMLTKNGATRLVA